MQLNELLAQLDAQSLDMAVSCFNADSYPTLFFSHLLRAARTSQVIQAVDTQQSISQIQTQCSMSFLGQHQTLWLGNVSGLEKRKQQQLLNFCATYSGPHQLWLFHADPAAYSANWRLLPLPEKITFQEYKSLCAAWYPQLVARVAVLEPLFNRYTIDVAFASLLLQYHLVLGRQADAFVDQWCTKLIQPEHSLFRLSTHFFAKQATPFFRLWKSIGSEYPPTFWATFWSEQLFRASCVTRCLREGNNYAQAKKLSYRLPFSFMQRDYKRANLKELQAAHQFMYDYDVHIKNSGTPEFLDVMFSSYFTGGFV